MVMLLLMMVMAMILVLLCCSLLSVFTFDCLLEEEQTLNFLFLS